MKRKAIEHLLPEVLRRTVEPGNPMFAVLEVMEHLHDTPENRLLNLPAFFDPRRAPPEFVPLLAAWVDLSWLFESQPGHRKPGEAQVMFSPGMDHLRELVAAATRLAHFRGTARGLLDFLRTATGIRGFEIDEHVAGADGIPKAYHIRIRAPREAVPHKALLERIIEFEKPAYVSYELEFGSDRPSGDDAALPQA